MATLALDTVTIRAKKMENGASFSLSKFRAGVGRLVRSWRFLLPNRRTPGVGVGAGH